MEPDELVDELLDDSSLFVSADAMVGYLDELPAAEELTGADSPTVASLDRACGRRRVQPQLASVVGQGHLPRRRRTRHRRSLLDRFERGFNPNAAPYIDPTSITPDAARCDLRDLAARVGGLPPLRRQRHHPRPRRRGTAQARWRRPELRAAHRDQPARTGRRLERSGSRCSTCSTRRTTTRPSCSRGRSARV